MQQLRHFQKEPENSVIPKTLLMAILLYFIMLLYFVSYYLYSNVYGFTLYISYYIIFMEYHKGQSWDQLSSMYTADH